MVSKVFLGLGSNVGESEVNLRTAIKLIEKNKQVVLINNSSLYETKPYGPVSQNNFYNLVVEIKTEYSPTDLFDFLKEVEQKIGREPAERWGPRSIDIDILLYSDVVVHSEVITIPHKDMLNRDFVLLPLLEIEPDIVHPELHKKVNEIMSGSMEKTIISKKEFRL